MYTATSLWALLPFGRVGPVLTSSEDRKSDRLSTISAAICLKTSISETELYRFEPRSDSKTPAYEIFFFPSIWPSIHLFHLGGGSDNFAPINLYLRKGKKAFFFKRQDLRNGNGASRAQRHQKNQGVWRGRSRDLRVARRGRGLCSAPPCYPTPMWTNTTKASVLTQNTRDEAQKHTNWGRH